MTKHEDPRDELEKADNRRNGIECVEFVNDCHRNCLKRLCRIPDAHKIVLNTDCGSIGMVVTNSQAMGSHIDTRHARAHRQPLGDSLTDGPIAKC